ncbi:hypothetical protein BJX99DRAFT_10979 [Aspergillus californicus]
MGGIDCMIRQWTDNGIPLDVLWLFVGLMLFDCSLLLSLRYQCEYQYSSLLIISPFPATSLSTAQEKMHCALHGAPTSMSPLRN